MCVEYAQILSSAHWMNNSSAPYKLTHKNHPCSKWVRSSLSNYRWLVKYALLLCKEYTYRYGKTHKTQAVVEWLKENEPSLPNKRRTSFVKCMPDEYKVKSPIESYREYYRKEKREFAKWKNRSVPDWF